MACNPDDHSPNDFKIGNTVHPDTREGLFTFQKFNLWKRFNPLDQRPTPGEKMNQKNLTPPFPNRGEGGDDGEREVLLILFKIDGTILAV